MLFEGPRPAGALIRLSGACGVGVMDQVTIAARAKQLERGALEAFKAGDTARSAMLAGQSLALAEEAADPELVVMALAAFMRLALRAGDTAEVKRLAYQADLIALSSGEPALRRVPIHMLAEAARMSGEMEEARRLYLESIALNSSLGREAMVGVEMANLSWVEIHEGDLDEAERLLTGSLERTPSDDRYGQAFGLLGLARVGLLRGDAAAAGLLDTAVGILETEGMVWDPADEAEYLRTLDLAREVVGTGL